MTSEVSNMGMPELHELRRKLGMPGKRGESRQQLVTRLMFVMYPNLLDELTGSGTEAPQLPKTNGEYPPPFIEHPSSEEILLPLEPVANCVPADVLKAVDRYKDKGLQVRFLDNYKTWNFKNGAAEDSGSMSMPIAAIKRKAEMIMTARFPAKVDGDFDKLGIPVLGA